MLSDYATVITGAGSGMGAAAAHRFAREGARVVISDIDEAAAIAVAREIDPSGVRALGVRCDVAVAEDCAGLVATAERFFGGPVDVFLANAGVSFAGDFLTADPAALRRIIDVNVTAASFRRRPRCAAWCAVPGRRRWSSRVRSAA